MNWLYSLQTRAGLAGPEGTAALVVVVALAFGFIAREFQSNTAPVAPDFYAADDAAFARPALDSATVAESLTQPASLSEPFPDPLASEHEWADTISSGDDAPSPAALASAEVESAASSRRTTKPPPRRLNINTASAEDLQCLPRIGPALAERIVEYRRVNGRFGSAAEITAVKGIGDRTYEKLLPWIFI